LGTHTLVGPLGLNSTLGIIRQLNVFFFLFGLFFVVFATTFDTRCQNDTEVFFNVVLAD
jgi:hypothetical protein